MDDLTFSLVPRPRRLRLLGGVCRPRMSVGAEVVGAEVVGSEILGTEVVTHLLRDGSRGMHSELGAEGYRLRCSENGVTLEAATEAGVSYGLATLRQVLSGGDDGDAPSRELPSFEIEDGPRFPWRGLHLDVVRHFFSADRVREAIDWCSNHKLNRFHWHLTDDQGWRLPVPARPRLTEIGAWRHEENGARTGGFYTEQEIRSVVDHAAARHVLVVPEIESPGHARAALAAYPELSCTGEAQPVPPTWGIFDDVLCAGNDAAFDFLEDVLTTTARLFPGPYMHVGGDEVPKGRWLACPRCRARMEREGLSSGEALQSWFLGRVARIVRGLGRTLVGWEEILEGGAPPGSLVMSWRGSEGGATAARAGLDAVLCPTDHCYLDSYQGPRTTEPRAFPRDVPLEAAYALDPLPPGISRIDARHILGGQACVWTEYISTWEHLSRMTFPRLCAIAEALWTPPERRDYADFLRRMERHAERLRKSGVDPYPLPDVPAQ